MDGTKGGTRRRGERTAATGTLPRWPAALALVALAACSNAPAADPVSLARGPGGEGTVFLAQTEAPEAIMDALFEGRVVRDPAGCLRLDGPDPATVVWPKDFSLEERGGELLVVAEDGGVAGRVGGPFRLGGGEVPFLHDGIPVSDEDRRLAAERCPGRYWIVGEVL